MNLKLKKYIQVVEKLVGRALQNFTERQHIFVLAATAPFACNVPSNYVTIASNYLILMCCQFFYLLRRRLLFRLFYFLEFIIYEKRVLFLFILSFIILFSFNNAMSPKTENVSYLVP